MFRATLALASLALATAAPARSLRESPTKPPPPPMCCMAMTAQCLSCSAGVSVDEYCQRNPRTTGCSNKPEPEPEPPVCCRAMTAQCLSCSAGVSVDEYCRRNPRTAGCKATPVRPCPVMGMLVCPNNAAPVCGEPTVLFPGCTLPSCKCPAVRPAPGGKCAKGTPDFASTIEHCGKPFTDMKCTCTEGLWMCAAGMPPPCSTTPPPPPPRNECQRAQRGSKCRTCEGSSTCACQDDQATLGHELTCMAVKKPEPPVCCEAMNAQCLSCSAGVSVDEYCRENPRTAGCPVTEPMCALVRCEAGTVCVEGKGCVKKPEPPACCKAMTATCLACADQVSVAEYCRKNPVASGCKATPEPEPLCADTKASVCRRLAEPGTQKFARQCGRKNFRNKCQQSCGLCE